MSKKKWLIGLAVASTVAALLVTPGSAYAFPDNGDSTLADNAAKIRQAL